jgi:hypothetical protein
MIELRPPHPEKKSEQISRSRLGRVFKMSLREAAPGEATKQSSWIAAARPAGLAMTRHFEDTP